MMIPKESQQPSPTLPHEIPPSPSPLPPFNTTLLAVQRRRKPPPVKLPHILSESSLSSTPRSHVSNFPSNFFPTAHSTYSSTPSQTSSVWNWKNFYPPPPPLPDSDCYPEQEQHHQHTQTPSHYSHKTQNTNPQDTDSERSEYDYFDEKLEAQKTDSHSHSQKTHAIQLRHVTKRRIHMGRFNSRNALNNCPKQGISWDPPSSPSARWRGRSSFSDWAMKGRWRRSGRCSGHCGDGAGLHEGEEGEGKVEGWVWASRKGFCQGSGFQKS